MSNNLTRKVRRQKSNKIKKDAGKEIKKQVSLFRRLPDTCCACGKTFDKKSRENHMTWQVSVHQEEQLVYLMCPKCVEEK